MKPLFKLFISFAIVTSVLGCSKKTGVFTTDDCKEANVGWSVVESGYDRKLVIDLAAKLQAAVSADSTTIKNLKGGKADVNLKIGGIFGAKEYRKAVVSPELFNQSVAHRLAMCSMWRMIKEAGLTDTQKEKVIDQMMEFTAALKNIEASEKKNLN